jgi:hypothetical protein
MSIDAVSPEIQLSSARPQRLASAAGALAATLPEKPSIEFRLTDRAYVQSWVSHTTVARRDHVNDLWVISCESGTDDWCSGEQRCCGSFSAEQALEWGEQLWSGVAELPYPRQL